MKILVVGGGYSSERDVSLKSSGSVYKASLSAGHETFYYDWDGSTDWLEANVKEYDVVLPILHGAGGEDGVIQRILEKNDARYLGSDSSSSEDCFNKQECLKILHASNIQIPRGGLVSFEEYLDHALFGLPHVLKPFDGGSSLDTFILPDIARRNLQTIKKAFSEHGTLLLEEYIDGIEITVPVLEGKDLSVIEIAPPENGVFDYENKYNGKTKELLPPENVSVNIQKQAKVLANKIHNIMGCRHFSRVDMIIRNEEIFVLEVNTIPGMTDQSLFPKAALEAGMNFPVFVDYLIQLVASP